MISFEAIKRLELTLPTMDHQLQGDFYEVEFAGAKMIVNHIFYPLVGPVYAVSFSGYVCDIETMIDGLTIEFGQPLEEEGMVRDGYRFFRSSTTKIPETLVHQVIGGEEISSACAKYELNDDERRLMQELLANMTTMFGKTEERVAYVAKITENLTEGQRENFLDAFREIILSFALAARVQAPG